MSDNRTGKGKGRSFAMASRGAKKPAPPQPAALAANNKRNRIKVLSMGDPGVGKSALIKRYCEGRVSSRCGPQGPFILDSFVVVAPSSPSNPPCA